MIVVALYGTLCIAFLILHCFAYSDYVWENYGMPGGMAVSLTGAVVSLLFGGLAASELQCILRPGWACS